jgi:exosortase
MPMEINRLRFGRLKLPAGFPVVAGMALALTWVYWATFIELGHAWSSESQYSHGYFVPLFSIYLLWARREMLAGDLHPSWWGVPLLVAGLALRFAGVYVYFDWLTAASLLPCLAAACLFVGGWRTLRWAWPAIAFLVFMIPLPYTVEVALSHPLQRIGTIISTFALQTMGLAAYSEGNVIVMGDVRIGVVEACSGLSMLMIFFALSTAVTLLIQRSPLERTLIFLSAVPIALGANIIRIIVTALLHKIAGSELADLVFHKLAGWLMMPLALGMLWVELRLLGWVLISPRPIADFKTSGFGLAKLGRGAPNPRASFAGGPKAVEPTDAEPKDDGLKAEGLKT